MLVSVLGKKEVGIMGIVEPKTIEPKTIKLKPISNAKRVVMTKLDNKQKPRLSDLVYDGYLLTPEANRIVALLDDIDKANDKLFGQSKTNKVKDLNAKIAKIEQRAENRKNVKLISAEYGIDISDDKWETLTPRRIKQIIRIHKEIVSKLSRKNAIRRILDISTDENLNPLGL